MTSKSMMKIQVEMAALRQILGTVSNGVQRNAVAVEKLKKETVQVSFHSIEISLNPINVNLSWNLLHYLKCI